ncbi:MAG: hypothetical protein ACJAS1_005933 [Oleiphilaceae bacterium]|jgi:general secretion pathway protein D
MLGILEGENKPLSAVKSITIVIIFICFSQTSFAAKARMAENLTIFQFGKIVAEELDYAIIFSPRVRINSKVALVLSEAIELDHLYDIFLGVLNVHGYAAVKKGDLIRVVRERKARTLPSDY